MAPPFFSPLTLHMPHWPKLLGQEPEGIPAKRTKTLLNRIGNPEMHLPPVIHVGGTKGKGSTVAFLRSIFEAAGYKTHVYTSPHIERFNERIVLDGHEISDTELHSVIEEVRIAAGDMPVGFFDATTAAAMLAFANHPADILLMEMGLGGTVDATNIINNPLLTVMTTISYDHMEIMGNTLESIAHFEAGLFKPNINCVVSYQHPDVLPVLEEEAEKAKTPLYTYGKNWLARKGKKDFIFTDTHGEVELPLPSLLGAHQIVNAGNAIAAVSILENFDITEEHIKEGLLNTQWKGRLQRIHSATIPKGSELWFDGGHNMAAAQAISLHIAENWQDKPCYLIFGTSLGKNLEFMLTPFKGLVKHIYSVPSKSEPSSYGAQTIANKMESFTNITACDGISDAVHAIMQTEKTPFRALVFGSLYLWLETNTV